MTKPAVYLETSVVGYATSRPSRDLVVAARQQITREWFALRAQGYELFVSQLVASEASGGDEAAARERAASCKGSGGSVSRTQVESSRPSSSRAEPCPGRPRRTPFTLRLRRSTE